jgi:hypothetical protein
LLWMLPWIYPQAPCEEVKREHLQTPAALPTFMGLGRKGPCKGSLWERCAQAGMLVVGRKKTKEETSKHTKATQDSKGLSEQCCRMSVVTVDWWPSVSNVIVTVQFPKNHSALTATL